MVWCSSRKKNDLLRLFEADGEEIFSKSRAKAGEKMEAKGSHCAANRGGDRATSNE